MFVLLLNANGSFAQKASLTAYVVDTTTNEKLIGATIQDLTTLRLKPFGYTSIFVFFLSFYKIF